MTKKWIRRLVLPIAIVGAMVFITAASHTRTLGRDKKQSFDQRIAANMTEMFEDGRQTFRFATFGDEAFWGDTLHLNQTIAGAALGGVGPGLSPSQALALGLKVDVDALPRQLQQDLSKGRVDLNDAATTLALLQLNSVVGVTGFFSSGKLQSVGIQCALCHSTVDNAFAPGIGHRLDGWPNRDLNVGAIIAFAPDLSALVTLLEVTHPGITQDQVRAVLNTWGPGKFDAELALDGKAFRPDGKTAATLIPPAFGLAGVNLHTWTGWGSVPHWNAFVANLEMHGKGRFWDPRLNDAGQFPIAAHFGFGDLPHISPDDDQITGKLAALHFYQLAIPAPPPPDGSFDAASAARGDALFSGKAKCNSCHVEPLWSEPGWNLHMPAEIGIDSFQADRAPDHHYRTSPLGGLWTHTKGGFYHDGRFPTLLDVVNHYDTVLSLGLTAQEKSDVVEYLKSLPSAE